MIAGNRLINYLRISITDRCNFRCSYCIPADPFKEIPHERIARYEEILRITRLAAGLGITKVRLTGGEPFVRKGIFPFIEQLMAIEGLEDISVTTNGSLLDKVSLQRLSNAGIQRINFSLDTLNPDTFKKITRRDLFDKVWENILCAHDLGFSPVKINTVVLRGINDHEIQDIAGLTLRYPFHIRFIEYMPMGDAMPSQTSHILTDEIRQRIEKKHGMLTACARTSHDGPAKKYKIKAAKGVVGFITPISSHFCAECNRLRLTARGTLRPCLLNDFEQEILTPLRSGADDTALKKIIEQSLTHKPDSHSLENSVSDIKMKKPVPLSHMTSIGG